MEEKYIRQDVWLLQDYGRPGLSSEKNNKTDWLLRLTKLVGCSGFNLSCGICALYSVHSISIDY
jgi:hypothetical protein